MPTGSGDADKDDVMARPMQWVSRSTGFLSLAPLTLTNFILYNSLSISSAAVKGATVTRMIVDLTFKNNALAQNNDAYWGIVPVNADASAAGGFPDPKDMTDRASWLVRGREQFNADSLSDYAQWVRVRQDLRSQRILRSEQDELHLLVENADGADTFQWAAFIRVLMKLP